MTLILQPAKLDLAFLAIQCNRYVVLFLLSFVPVRLLITPVAGLGWPLERVFGKVDGSSFYYERQAGFSWPLHYGSRPKPFLELGVHVVSRGLVLTCLSSFHGDQGLCMFAAIAIIKLRSGPTLESSISDIFALGKVRTVLLLPSVGALSSTIFVTSQREAAHSLVILCHAYSSFSN